MKVELVGKATEIFDYFAQKGIEPVVKFSTIRSNRATAESPTAVEPLYTVEFPNVLVDELIGGRNGMEFKATHKSFSSAVEDLCDLASYSALRFPDGSRDTMPVLYYETKLHSFSLLNAGDMAVNIQNGHLVEAVVAEESKAFDHVLMKDVKVIGLVIKLT